MRIAAVAVAVALPLALSACDKRDDAPAPVATASPVDAGDGEPVLVAFLGDDGVLTIDGATLLEDKAILARAEWFHARAPRGRIVLHCHPATLHGRAVRVMDLFREAEVTRVSLDVIEPG